MQAGRRAGGAEFDAPFDAVVIGMSVVVGGLLVVAGIGGAVIAVGDHSLLAGVLALLLIGGLVAAVLYAPTGYRVEPGTVIVERRVAPVRISLDGLQHATVGRPKNRVSLVGYRNGGLFLVSGRVWTRADGWMYFWGRRASNTVMLQFEHKLVVLMPDDTTGFVAAVDAARVVEPT